MTLIQDRERLEGHRGASGLSAKMALDLKAAVLFNKAVDTSFKCYNSKRALFLVILRHYITLGLKATEL